MSTTRSLTYLVDAVLGELGDVAGMFTPSLIERFINEGQRKLEPELLLDATATITWADAATTAALPADLYEITAIDPTDNASLLPVRYRVHANILYFDTRDTIVAFNGRLYYRAHYPEITDVADCALPEAGADGLIAYALYKCWHKIAASRSEYRRYATLVGNGVTIADLEQIATNHLADFNEIKVAAQRLPEPQPFYTDR